MRPGNAAGEPHYRMFRRRISPARRSAPQSGDRGGIQDNAFFRLAHVGQNRARDDEGARYIDGEYAVPQLGRYVLTSGYFVHYACLIAHYVDLPPLTHGGIDTTSTRRFT